MTCQTFRVLHRWKRRNTLDGSEWTKQSIAGFKQKGESKIRHFFGEDNTFQDRFTEQQKLKLKHFIVTKIDTIEHGEEFLSNDIIIV